MSVTNPKGAPILGFPALRKAIWPHLEQLPKESRDAVDAALLELQDSMESEIGSLRTDNRALAQKASLLVLRRKLERRRYRSEMTVQRQLARLDHLTELYLGSVFKGELVAASIVDAIRERRQHADRRTDWMSVWVVDYNNFKLVNDLFGHLAGDKALKGAAACLKRTFRSRVDLLSRDGDEFYALQTFVRDLDAVYDAAVRLHGNLALHDWKPVHPHLEEVLPPRMAVGIVVFPLGETRDRFQRDKASRKDLSALASSWAAQLVARADALMYQHKHDLKTCGQVGAAYPAWIRTVRFDGDRVVDCNYPGTRRQRWVMENE